MSPGVERAIHGARQWAARLGADSIQLTHFILSLLDEEEGRVALLLERLGLSTAYVREQLLARPAVVPAPPVEALCAAARDWSVLHRHDPQLLTDALFLAVVKWDGEVARHLAAIGLDVPRLEALLTGATAAMLMQTVASPPSCGDNILSPATPDEARNGTAAATDGASACTNRVAGPEISAEPSGEPSVAREDGDLTAMPTSSQPAATPDLAALAAQHPVAQQVRDEGAPAALAEPWPAAVLRILDVNCNRAREAARVIDDFCRFVLNDRSLTEEIKNIRHQLAQLEQQLPLDQRLNVRDTAHDVGTDLLGGLEYRRLSPEHVLQTNLKRLQESLRSLEEYGKLGHAGWAGRIEQIRYRTYQLEKRLHYMSKSGKDLDTIKSGKDLHSVRLYLLLSGDDGVHGWEWLLEEAVAGGVQMVQLREKNLADREWLRRAEALSRWCHAARVPIIINDRPDIAAAVGADGVHLGQDDLPVAAARRLLGDAAWIGVSTHNLTQLHQAIADGADYVGIGPVYPSPTKALTEIAGLEYVRAASQATQLPAFALGGITPDNLAEVLQAGVRRVAVSSAITRSANPREVARTLRRLLDAVNNSAS